MPSFSPLRGARLRAFVPAFCCLIIIADGYDVSVLGATVPVLLTYPEWGLTAAQVGLIASLGLLGLLLGSLLCGFATDLLGRKRMLVLSSGWFSLCMLGCALAPAAWVFGLFRFLGGMGLGGVIPVCLALAIEFAWPSRRYLFAAIGNAGFSVGAIAAALLGIAMLPDLGFRPMYAIGAFPLLLIPVALLVLPESVDFLVSKGRLREAQDLARRLALPVPEPAPATATGQPSGLRTLTRRPLLGTLALFGLCGIAVQILIYGLNTWLPQIMKTAGHGLTSALAFLAAMSVGAIVGSLVLSTVADRLSPRVVLVAGFAIGVLALVVLSAHPSTALAYVAVALAGVGGSGTAGVLHAFAGTWFPAGVRASAVGTYLAVSRLGSIVGPAALGWVIAAGLPLEWTFFVLATPTAVGVLVVLLLPRRNLDGTPLSSRRAPRTLEPTIAGDAA